MSKNKTLNNKIKNNEILDSLKIYSKTDYESNDGMLTSVWGPGLWHYMHTMSFNYPVHPTEENKKNYKEFILNLKNVLPCGKCRKNLCKNLIRLPLTDEKMRSRETFSRYIFDLHEIVNTMLGKKSGLTYEIVKERYEHFRARCAKSYKRANIKKNKTMKRVRFSKNVSIMNEKGCTVPLYGEKSKCVLKIVPHDTKCDTLQIDDKCIKKRIPI
uniref:thiol oxidase n=1 Tax=viral metagenome TaxID=1070528 RepID=A0A6C0JKU0_9ZZZZ